MAVYVWEHETLEVLPCCGEPKYEPINAEVFHTRITSKYYGDDYAKIDEMVLCSKVLALAALELCG